MTITTSAQWGAINWLPRTIDPWLLVQTSMEIEAMRRQNDRARLIAYFDQLYTRAGYESFVATGRPVQIVTAMTAFAAAETLNTSYFRQLAYEWPDLDLLRQKQAIRGIVARWTQTLPLPKIEVQFKTQKRYDRDASYVAQNNLHRPSEVVFYDVNNVFWRDNFLEMLELLGHEVLGHGCQEAWRTRHLRARYLHAYNVDYATLRRDFAITRLNNRFYVQPQEVIAPNWSNNSGRNKTATPYWRQPNEVHARYAGAMLEQQVSAMLYGDGDGGR